MRLRAVRTAVELVAIVLSYCLAWALCRRFAVASETAVTSAVLALVLSRRPASASRGHVLESAATIASIALLTAGVGLLFVSIPWIGALVFVAGVSLSVWLRNFGSVGRRIGALVALPLVAMLIVPRPRFAAPSGPLADVALTICAGLIPLLCVSVVRWIAARFGLPSSEPERRRADDPARVKRPGLTPATRMAFQMAAALAAAFVAGFVLFPTHWGWVVLTAFIVCGGALGRGDAFYKGVLRLLGAACGTVAAAATSLVHPLTGPAEAVAVFGVLYAGLLLRSVNYAYWAAAITLVLAMLAGSDGANELTLLGVRLAAILVGAVCAVAATWFVYPIQTRDVVRRRLADALVAFDEFVAHAHLGGEEKADRLASFEHHLRELERVAPPLRWHRRLGGGKDDNHPAAWLDAAAALGGHARAIDAANGLPDARRGPVRRAIGLTRKAIGNHGKADAAPDVPPVAVALDDLHHRLAGGG
jgi:hypothetical protein